MAFEGLIGRAKAAWKERQLTIPDNPAVIQELEAALAAKSQPVEACLRLYHRAAKQDQQRWERVTRTIIGRVMISMREMEPATRSVDVAEALLRKRQFDEYDHTIVAQLGDDPILALEYQREKVPLERNLFNPAERFLLRQPTEALDALANFLPEQQIDIAMAWEQQPELPWLDILTDADSPTLVDVILSFPSIEQYVPSRDRQAILAIGRRFTVAERAKAWEKAGQPTGSWDDIYAYLVVASFPESTTEQIRLLNSEQWSYITLTLLAHGEAKVREMWSTDAILDVKECSEQYYWARDNTPARVIGFVKTLSEVVKQHLPMRGGSGTSWESPARPGRHVSTLDGFQALSGAIAQFQNALRHVPAEYQDALFSVLKKDQYYSNSDRWESATDEQTANFIQYVERTGAEGKVQLDVFISERAAFTGERWRNVAQGTQVCQEQGLVIPDGKEYNLYGHLTVYESAGLPEQAVTNQFWRKCQDRSTVFSTQKGSHAKDFGAVERSDISVWRLQQFAKFHQKYFSANTELVANLLNLTDHEKQIVARWPNIDTAIDLPVIEGMVVALGSQLSELGKESRTQLDRFVQLTTEQQQRWLWLNKNILWMGGVSKGEYAELIFQLAGSKQGEQVQTFLETTGLTGFLPETTLAMAERLDCVGLFYYLNKEKIGHDQQKLIVDRLITLHDAGFPQEYDRASYNVEGSIDTISKYGSQTTIGHLLEWDPAQLAEHAKFAVANHLVPFVELLKVSPTISVEQFQHLIRLAAAERTDYLQSYRAVDPAEIDLIQERVSRTEQLTDVAIDYSTISRLHTTTPIWERLVGNATILKLYLTGKSGSFPEVGLALPDELLLQPGVWAYNYPAAVWADPVRMQTVLDIQARFATAGVTIERYGTPWARWVDAWQTAPWLFSQESLVAFQQCDVFLLPQFTSLSESEWTEIRPVMAHYRFAYQNDVTEFIAQWRNQTLPSATQLAELHKTVGAIPWTSEERDPNVWKKARCAFLRGKVVADLPTFGQYVDDSIEFWQELAQLPRPVLQNLELLSPCAQYLHNYKDFIAVAAHPNFTLALPVMLQKEHLIPLRLVDALTPAIVERVQTWPKELEINLKDMADFLADPRAEAIFAFAQELRKIFSTDFRMSVYDLLIMDVEQDLANVRQLQRECTLPVTPDHLRRLAPITTGEMQQTITKLLAMFDASYKIDFHQSTQQLAALDTPLRVATILAKGPGNFGWSIMPYRRELIDALAVTSEQVDDLTRKCYRNNRSSLPVLDAAAATALLTETGLQADQKATQLADVLQHYAGAPGEILDIVYSDPPSLIKLAYDGWGKVPDYVKQNRRFWELALEHAPLFFIDHYAERVEAVSLTPAAIARVIEKGGSGQLNTLVNLAQQGEITLSTEQTGVVTVRYIETGGDLDVWLADDAKRQLLQHQLAAVACSWRSSDTERKAILEQFVSAGLIAEANLRPAQVVTAGTESKLLAAMLSKRQGGIQGMDTELSLILGERAQSAPLIHSIVRNELRNLSVDTVTERNWLPAVLAFVRTTIEDHQLPQISAQLTEQVTAAFKSTEAKDMCLTELQRLWKRYLQAGAIERMPIQLTVVTGWVDDCEGAGPMGQFEALSLFIHQFRLALTRASTVEHTQQTVIAGVNTMENRFTKERWSDEDKADYYNISRDVLQAAPSLYNEFLVVFQRLSAKDLKRFHEQVYPLFRAQLAVLAEPGRQEGEVKFKPRELVKLRQLLRETTNMDALRATLVTAMTEKFKTRFGITKIPEQFTAEHVRSLTNNTMYLANMSSRTETKEQWLGLYLALQLNGKWDAYRRGETIDPAEYLTPDKAKAVTELMQQRQQLSPLTAERLRISAEQLPEFQTLLQVDTPTIALGDVETIDVRLGNVITNLRTLEDLDLYPDPLDKQRMAVLLEYGNKRVGSVAAKLYRGIELGDGEVEIRDKMQAVLAKQSLPFTPETIKAYWQEGLKALAVVVNTVRLIEDTNAVEEIDSLRTILQPSAEVIAIFNRLGEEFKVTSGALALTQDLDYLDNIIVKRSDELSEAEVKILQTYVKQIRDQVIKLQTVYDQIKVKFGNMRQAQSSTPNELLRTKLGQIDTIMQAESAQQTVTTTLTHDWNAIVENIRECLSCTKQGCNNDTDLTFGDGNKFFLYSHTEAQRKGSIADEIVFLTPLTTEHGGTEVSFVMDRVYGKCTPFILTNHITTVLKKYRQLKTRFADSAVSVFVTDAALSTGGLSVEQLTARLRAQFGDTLQFEQVTAEVDITASATGDHYVEFGGGPRTVGKRTVTGLLLRTA